MPLWPLASLSSLIQSFLPSHAPKTSVGDSAAASSLGSLVVRVGLSSIESIVLVVTTDGRVDLTAVVARPGGAH